MIATITYPATPLSTTVCVDAILRHFGLEPGAKSKHLVTHRGGEITIRLPWVSSPSALVEAIDLYIAPHGLQADWSATWATLPAGGAYPATTLTASVVAALGAAVAP